jgi:hypothetical protein
VFASEATFCVVLINYWAKDAVPDAALRMSLFFIATVFSDTKFWKSLK